MTNVTFARLPKFTRTPSYRVQTEWRHLPETIERYTNPRDGLAALDLNPDFQRGHVWTPEQQSRYVEYVLQGGASGLELYFNCVGWMHDWVGPFVIVDGKQRLHAALEFLANRVPIFNGCYYKDFTDRLPSHTTFTFCVNNLKTRAEVLRWYLELNTGGTPHTDTEITRVRQLLMEEATPQRAGY